MEKVESFSVDIIEDEKWDVLICFDKEHKVFTATCQYSNYRKGFVDKPLDTSCLTKEELHLYELGNVAFFNKVKKYTLALYKDYIMQVFEDRKKRAIASRTLEFSDRLTERIGNYYFPRGPIVGDHNAQMNKLGRYEDLEDQYCIKLDRLVDLIARGANVKTKLGVSHVFAKDLSLFPKAEGFWDDKHEHFYYFADYGKRCTGAWVLTHERFPE